MNAFKAAVVQMRSGMDPARNAADFEALVREAAGRGAAYVQSPEMTGALVRDRQTLRRIVKDEAGDLVVDAARRLAAELGIAIHVGSTAIALPDGKVANRAFLFDRTGALVATYDKIHMFDVDLDNGESWRESATYQPGARAVVAPLAGVPFGLAICYDLRFPHLFRAQALAGAAVLSAPAAFTRQTGKAHWHVLTRARAIENGAWLIAAAQGGRHEDGRETFGHSVIVDPWGTVAAEMPGDEPGIALAEIDPHASAAARAKIPNLQNARDFDLDMLADDGLSARRVAS
ncbi:carbon-nitrogen hydrolase family protein [Nitratireductor sp. StC3]|uniref:carbon-nitrogen hydrolase family protein n=1 Tax=Nitratireductor sp. StC3 TaxID=2126741 RepID=UPI000D0CA857|nr:carbon-nitrogen hydrolase family protein [Nitratireductor sp. StC3]PSM16048.1 nitrilase [Nitratireductor sp. StC3]